MSLNKEISAILKNHSLRNTECRSMVLDYFFNSETAISQHNLDQTIGEKFDRVTLYRTVKTFLKKGIIHQVLDPDGASKYALCKQECTVKNHNHNHIHFKCDTCGDTLCINSVSIPEINLPEGYEYNEVNLLVQGKCPKC